MNLFRVTFTGPMKLDYIQDINEYGDDIVRLYDFGVKEAILFRDAIQEFLVLEKEELDITSLKFIEVRNCKLVFIIGVEEEGVFSNFDKNFICSLTKEGFQHMISLIEPFCIKQTKGYQYLYDLDCPTDLLFSPAGTW